MGVALPSEQRGWYLPDLNHQTAALRCPGSSVWDWFLNFSKSPWDLPVVAHRGLQYWCLPPVGKKLCITSAAGLFPSPERWCRGESFSEDKGFQTSVMHPPVAKTGRDLEKEMLETRETSQRLSGPAFVYCCGTQFIAGVQEWVQSCCCKHQTAWEKKDFGCV